MSDWLMRKIRSEAKGLLDLAAADPELRVELRTLAEDVLRLLAEMESQLAPNAPGTLDQPEEPEASQPRETPAEAAGPEPLQALTLGQPRVYAPPEIRMAPSRTQQEAPYSTTALSGLEACCRAKAERARWVAEAQRRIHEGSAPASDDAPDEAMRAWASGLTDAYYFRSAADASGTFGIALLDDVAGCFETVAESLALVRGAEGHAKTSEHVLQLLAEAQSALRGSLQRVGIPEDPDQEQVYEWLRATTARERVYLRRHMRADDLADPASWPAIMERIEHARAASRKSPRVVQALEVIQDHQTRIRAGEKTPEVWRGLLAAVDALVARGMPPSSRELRDLLLPLIDELPEHDALPPHVARVVRAIDRFLATRPGPTLPPTATEPSAEVRQLAALLGGRSVVLIGGNRRRDSQEALTRAFGLKSLVWIETKEHQSVHTFEAQIARPDVAVVLLAIRWSSHAFGDVRYLCEAHGKPLVRLPGGYNPNQVAIQILDQCSAQLRRRGAADP